MPSLLHEALVELFRCRPALVAELLSDEPGVKVPGFRHARVESAELTDLAPAEYRADAVVRLSGDGNEPALMVVVEVQLRRDPAKRLSWPVYLATLHARWRCPAVVLVVCADQPVAGWCGDPIELGPGSVVSPVAVGPERVPMVTEPDQATRSPELAVLSAMAHGGAEESGRVFRALLAGLEVLNREQADLYADIVMAALPQAARRHLEDMMLTDTYEYQSPFARRYFFRGRAEGEARGRAEGEARAVLTVLGARGVEVPEEARARITGCTDIEQLETWVRRAATAGTVDDLFD